MKNFLLSLVLLFAQGIAAQVIHLDDNTTRAVVIGISDYQDDKIPDLRFADRDALAFAEFLNSPAGGALKNEQIALLTNWQATAGKVIAALTWLVEESKPGDRAVICFSGHGDVEQLTAAGWGYLLMHDSPATTYMAGAIPVPYLQEIIATLSGRQVEVVMVSDACHSGKLAGSARGGSQATANALAQKFGNEIKILSCQPDEFSIEGEEWGGGRGVFSYHLVDALYGFADRDKDLTVSLLEAQRYLQDTVPAESLTGQMPFTVGNPKTQLTTVAPESLIAWRQQKKQPGGISPFAGKGMDAVLLAGTDSTVQALYKAFNEALERGDLLTSPKGQAAATGQSANDCYLRLIGEPEAVKLHGIMTRNLAAALQDEAQAVINQILRTDPQIVDDAFSPVGKYDHLPAYLARAAELLGERHFMHRFLKAKEYYFRSKTYRKENYPDWSADSLLRLQLAALDTALGFDSMAAYVYFEKGYLQFWGMEGFPKVFLENFEKAIALSPEWVLPNYYAGRTLTYDLLDRKGVELLKRAIALDSNFLPAYRELGGGVEPPEGYRFWKETFIRKMEEYYFSHPQKVPITYYNYLGNVLMSLNRYDEAETVLLKGAELSNHQFPLIYMNLAGVYLRKKEYNKMIEANEKIMELMPLTCAPYQNMAIYFIYVNQPEQAENWLLKGLKLAPKDNSMNVALAFILMEQQQFDSAFQLLQQSLPTQIQPREHYLRLAQLFELTGQPDSARAFYQKLLPKKSPESFGDYDYQSVAYSKLGMEEKFEESIQQWQKHFPESPNIEWNLCCLYAFLDKDEQCLAWLEKAFQKRLQIPYLDESIHGTFYNPDFHLIRYTPAFQSLVKKYLPEYFKD